MIVILSADLKFRQANRNIISGIVEGAVSTVSLPSPRIDLGMVIKFIGHGY